ncbi:MULTISPECIES: alpha/beta fold hydrolase [Fischerella]|uniref:Alpha/beta hydrolase n=1 Tax=Fischerella muscicola CCMEE 5323 TaxID=2019572 RepID=A0A2N6JY21_FISMU|nr:MULTISPECIES: alpha/beta fold hydrolase [Fischerella]MBD2432540.1 alpha/beta fold hydrolase [Fischerella sp. FACHB-380]PLZ85663.1 alpha/beta hydrolase [Fischerella muscicola CCMEE 5323]
MTVNTQQLPTTATFAKHIWTWQGYKIQYTVLGTGKPLVLVHGFGACIGHWRKNIPVLANAGYQVFALDLLGFGGSEKAPIDYTVEVWVELLKDFWIAHINEPAVFIGNSIGALLSLMVLAEHPEIAVGGVLINSAGGLSHRPHELNPPLRVVMSAFNKLVGHPITGSFVFNRIRQKHQIRRTLYQVYRDRQAVTDELVDLLYTPSCDPGAQKVFASILTAPPGPTPAELLPKVQHPLLVIWGADDPWTPITGAKIYEQAQENGKNIKIVPIPGAGHCPHDEVPDVVNSQIVEWLGSLSM